MRTYGAFLFSLCLTACGTRGDNVDSLGGLIGDAAPLDSRVVDAGLVDSSVGDPTDAAPLPNGVVEIDTFAHSGSWNLLSFTRFFADVGTARATAGGLAVIMSADGWSSYFGTPPPADLDFNNEWVLFYGLGAKANDGFGGDFLHVFHFPDSQSIKLDLFEILPAPAEYGCPPRIQVTYPVELVRIPAQAAPIVGGSQSSDYVRNCGPAVRAQLADSKVLWEQLRDANQNTYGVTFLVEDVNTVLASTHTARVVEEGVVTRFRSHLNSEETGFEWVLESDLSGDEVGDGHQFNLDDHYSRCLDISFVPPTHDSEDQWSFEFNFWPSGILRDCRKHPSFKSCDSIGVECGLLSRYFDFSTTVPPPPTD